MTSRRAPLRTKTGCQRCKQRKKKCDEVKPKCGACQRWSLLCIWPTPHKASGAVAHGQSLFLPGCSFGTIRTLNGHGCPAFYDQAQVFLLDQFNPIYQSFICPLAGSDYVNLSGFVSIALNEPWSRHALVALVGYMFFARTANLMWEEYALASYQMAVVRLRDKVHHGLHHRDLVPILVAATCLGLMEGLGTGNAETTIAHFSLVAQLGQNYLLRRGHDQTLLPVVRVILEDVVYNLACMSIFRPVPRSACEAIDWTRYRCIFSETEFELPVYHLSPHFGGNHEFYRLILIITSFSREPHSADTRAKQVHEWLVQLDCLEQRLEYYYTEAPERVAQMYIAKYRLHAIALRIYCFKIRRHELPASASEVVYQVRQAQEIFCRNILYETHNPALTWPLIVILCACSDYITFQFFVQQIEHIKLNFGRGHLRNLDTVMDILKSTLVQSDGPISPSQDNLWMLLLKEGILSAPDVL